MKLKYLLLALCVAMSSAFVSCKDDDDKEDSGSVVGTWKQDYSDFFGWDEVAFGYCRFQKDGKYIDFSYYQEDDEEPEIEVSYGTWSQSGSTLTIKLDGETSKFTITSLDSKYMTLVYTDFPLSVVLEKCSDSEMDKYLNKYADD